MKKYRISAVIVLVMALILAAASTALLVMWQTRCDTYLLDNPTAVFVPIESLGISLPENITMPGWTLIPYGLFLLIYCNLYTTGVDKEYIAEPRAKYATFLGAWTNVVFVSYACNHMELDLSPLMLLCVVHLAFYFWHRMYWADAEGALDRRGSNMAGLFIAFTLGGLCVDQVFPLMFTILLLVIMVGVFLVDLVKTLTLICRKGSKHATA